MPENRKSTWERQAGQKSSSSSSPSSTSLSPLPPTPPESPSCYQAPLLLLPPVLQGHPKNPRRPEAHSKAALDPETCPRTHFASRFSWTQMRGLDGPRRPGILRRAPSPPPPEVWGKEPARAGIGSPAPGALTQARARGRDVTPPWRRPVGGRKKLPAIPPAGTRDPPQTQEGPLRGTLFGPSWTRELPRR